MEEIPQLQPITTTSPSHFLPFSHLHKPQHSKKTPRLHRRTRPKRQRQRQPPHPHKTPQPLRFLRPRPSRPPPLRPTPHSRPLLLQSHAQVVLPKRHALPRRSILRPHEGHTRSLQRRRRLLRRPQSMLRVTRRRLRHQAPLPHPQSQDPR